MPKQCGLICLTNEEGKREWLQEGGAAALIFSKNQLMGQLAIGEALPDPLIFEGSLKDCIHSFAAYSVEEGSKRINPYLEQGVAQWTENGWECFTCRTAVLGCCSGFYLSIVNKKDF